MYTNNRLCLLVVENCMLELNERIRALRKQKGLTQEQLAKRLWVTKSIISAYESGVRYPSLEMLIKLARIFFVSTDYLLGVNSKQTLDVSELSQHQITIIKNIIDEFKND